MKIKTTLLALTMLTALTSCVKTLPPMFLDGEKSFVPGDCLISTEVEYKGIYIGQYEVIQGYYRFMFKLGEWSTVYDPLEWIVPWGQATSFRYIPSDDVYAQFGSNNMKVKKAYETEYKNTWRPNNPYLVKNYEVYYESGLSVTADREFAGYPAGENIASCFAYNSLNPHTPIPNEELADLSIIGDWRYAAGSLLFDVHVKEEKNDVKEAVTFTMNIPVKVGLALTWLANRLSDPDAPYPYREETLTCTFTVPADELNKSHKVQSEL